MAFEKLKETLEKNGFTVSVFADGKAAAEYLNREMHRRHRQAAAAP